MHGPWRMSFDTFLAHIGLPPSALHQIDRINNNKGYVPGNLRWATRVQNCNNRRNSKHPERAGLED